MNARKITIMMLAATLSVPAVSVYAAQKFGRDSVYAESGKSYGTARVVRQVQRFGRDSAHVKNETVLSRSPRVDTGEGPVKPGRA